MDVSFYTLGCKLNYAESSQLSTQFENAGHRTVNFGDVADIIIINTCTVTHNADRECRQVIRRALKRSPHAFVCVTGCYAQLQPEEIASIEGVDAVLGAKEKFEILRLIPEFVKGNPPRVFVSELDEDIAFTTSQSADNDSRTRAFLKIQDGCNYKCSFCTIPLARGRSRSQELGGVAERIRELEDNGYSEIVLSGINLGDYSTPHGEKFIDIVRMINAMQPRLRVRISSIEPNLLSREILTEVANSTVFCPHFHIPLQSGSPDILRAMRRRYTADYYRKLVEDIKTSMPNCAIGVDVIVGFPGETERHFNETYEFLRLAPVSYLHVFSYSERKNTPAISLPDKVSSQETQRRSRMLRNLSDKKRREFYRSQIGAERIVIPESRNPANGMWRGWTENYVRAEFEGDSGLLQAPTKVRLHEFVGEYVSSQFIEQTSALFRDSQTQIPAYIPIALQ